MKTMFVINYDGIKVKDIKPSEKEGIIDVLDEYYDCHDISKKDYIPVVKDGEIYHLVITDTLISLMINDDRSELIQFIDVDVIKPAF